MSPAPLPSHVNPGWVRQRLATLTDQLQTICGGSGAEPFAPRWHRLLWLYLFHLSTLAVHNGHPSVTAKSRALLTGLHPAGMGDDPWSPADRTLLTTFVEDLSHRFPPMSEPSASPRSGLADWWLNQVLVIDEALPPLLGAQLAAARVMTHGVPLRIPQILRAARRARPHLVIVDGATPRTLRQVVTTLRDDHRLDLSAIWATLPRRLSLHPNDGPPVWDGVVRQPGSRRDGARLLHAMTDMNRRRELALRDALTGLHSLGYFYQRLTEEVARHRRTGSAFGVICLTWNPWLWVVESPGSPLESFDLVHQAADYLCSATRHSDVVACDGIGRFYIAAFDVTRTQWGHRLTRLHRGLRDAALAPFAEDLPLFQTAAALFPTHGVAAEDLMDHLHQILWQRVPSETDDWRSPESRGAAPSWGGPP